MRQSGKGVVNLGHARIRGDLAELVKTLLEDPAEPGRMKYGSFRAYLERLIAKDMQERKALSDSVIEKILLEIKNG